MIQLSYCKSPEQCPDRAKHTPDPPGYIAWFEWAAKKARTHTQHRCPACGFYVIWKRKPRKREALSTHSERTA